MYTGQSVLRQGQTLRTKAEQCCSQGFGPLQFTFGIAEREMGSNIPIPGCGGLQRQRIPRSHRQHCVFPGELSFLLDGRDGSIEFPSRGAMDHPPARQRQPGRCGERMQCSKKRWVRACALIPGRTDSRIRSPRLTASSRWLNVDKGSRQNRCVTSGEALAPSPASLRLTW